MVCMPDNLDEYYYIQTVSGEFIIFHQVIVNGKFAKYPKKIVTVKSKTIAEQVVENLHNGKINESIFND
jgi:hypothetical protein